MLVILAATFLWLGCGLSWTVARKSNWRFAGWMLLAAGCSLALGGAVGTAGGLTRGATADVVAWLAWSMVSLVGGAVVVQSRSWRLCLLGCFAVAACLVLLLLWHDALWAAGMTVVVVGVVGFPLARTGDLKASGNESVTLATHEPWMSALAGGLLGVALLTAMPALLVPTEKAAVSRKREAAEARSKDDVSAGTGNGALGSVVTAALLLTTITALRRPEEDVPTASS